METINRKTEKNSIETPNIIYYIKVTTLKDNSYMHKLNKTESVHWLGKLYLSQSDLMVK